MVYIDVPYFPNVLISPNNSSNSQIFAHVCMCVPRISKIFQYFLDKSWKSPKISWKNLGNLQLLSKIFPRFSKHICFQEFPRFFPRFLGKILDFQDFSKISWKKSWTSPNTFQDFSNMFQAHLFPRISKIFPRFI